jgi:uncharacterized protein
MSDTTKGLQFPCEFTIKVFGTTTPEFEISVLSIIRKHVTTELRENAIQSRPSKESKYLALSVTITANNQEQLDTIYRELKACPLVMMAL